LRHEQAIEGVAMKIRELRDVESRFLVDGQRLDAVGRALPGHEIVRG
jgi:hypothetical protein